MEFEKNIQDMTLDEYKHGFSLQLHTLCEEIHFDDAVLGEQRSLHCQMEKNIGTNRIRRFFPIPTPGNGWCMIFSIIGGLLALNDERINKWLYPRTDPWNIESWQRRFAECIRHLDENGFLRRFREYPEPEQREIFVRDLENIMTNANFTHLEQGLGQAFVSFFTQHRATQTNFVVLNSVESQRNIPRHTDEKSTIYAFHTGAHFTLLFRSETLVFIKGNRNYPFLKVFLRAMTNYMKQKLGEEDSVRMPDLTQRVANLRANGMSEEQIQLLLGDEFEQRLQSRDETESKLEVKPEPVSEPEPEFVQLSMELKQHYKDLALKLQRREMQRMREIVDEILQMGGRDKLGSRIILENEKPFCELVRRMGELIVDAERHDDKITCATFIEGSDLAICRTLAQDMASLSQEILDHLFALSLGTL